jgi:hypothetical protein
MPKIRFYHVRTLLWTYLVWTPLNLWFAYACWFSAQGPFVRFPLRRTLYNWQLLHILPLWALWDGTGGFDVWVVVVLAGLAIVAGLLKNRQWARVLVVVGMSLWFFEAWCLLGIGV